MPLWAPRSQEARFFKAQDPKDAIPLGPHDASLGFHSESDREPTVRFGSVRLIPGPVHTGSGSYQFLKIFVFSVFFGFWGVFKP